VGLANELIFTEAVEQVQAILASQSSDEISDRLEAIVKIEDLALACFMLLAMKAKGIDISEANGIELANPIPTIADLIIASPDTPLDAYVILPPRGEQHE
jgi:hypothetical protein